MGNYMPKDGTAQGVAKVRHYETILPPEQRLYQDPYAYAMYPGSVVQNWMGPGTIDTLYSWMGLKGFQEMISIRTKWLDENILDAMQEKDSPPKQLIILGAGYDTRGFRLDLPVNDFKVFEVDQPEVQQKKCANLQWLEDEKKCSEIGERRSQVEFVGVNFNSDSLKDKLEAHASFQVNASSVVTLEGVTQYIPKKATAETLTELRAVVAPGSTLLITYVDKSCFDDPATLPTAFRMVKGLAAKTGEPWISGWSAEEFETFLSENGYQVVSDTTTKDYNGKYLEPLGRKLEEEHILNMERFVVAKVL